MRITVLVVCLAFAAITAQAGILTFANEALFQSQGAIIHNTNWDSYTGAFTFMGSPYTIGGVTYTSGDNLVVGPAGGYGNARPMLAYDGWSPLPGVIASSPETYDMFGFNIGLAGATSLVDIQIGTNLGSYLFTGLPFPNVTAGLAFQGFITDNSAEYFTSFILASQGGVGSAPMITDVQLGQAGASAIPEPATAALLACGLLGMAVYRGYRRSRL